MRIALISDIHANLPALEAVLADIDLKKPDHIFCLGDLVGCNIWPNEVIRTIRARAIPCIFGNYDFGIGIGSDDCGCAYRTDAERAMGAISIRFTNEVIGDDERDYLAGLPFSISLQFHIQGEKKNLVLVHGSPRKVNEYLFEDRDEKSLRRILADADADILCFGHTHKPYHRILSGDASQGDKALHAVNIGSVGKPKDGDNRAGYVLLTINAHAGNEADAWLTVSFERVKYDIERAAAAVENSILPDYYANALRNGV